MDRRDPGPGKRKEKPDKERPDKGKGLRSPAAILVRHGLIDMVLIFTAEYISGLWLTDLGICPWDYSMCPDHVRGVIRLRFAPLWFGAGLLLEWLTEQKLCTEIQKSKTEIRGGQRFLTGFDCGGYNRAIRWQKRAHAAEAAGRGKIPLSIYHMNKNQMNRNRIHARKVYGGRSRHLFLAFLSGNLSGKSESCLSQWERDKTCMEKEYGYDRTINSKTYGFGGVFPGFRNDPPLFTGQIPSGRQYAASHAHPGSSLQLSYANGSGDCWWVWWLLCFAALYGGCPMMPVAAAMAFELAAYGAVTGFLYGKMEKSPVSIYISLLSAMAVGRIVWGVVSVFLYGIMGKAFSVSLFLSGALFTAIPGIVLQLLLIPVIVASLEKARLIK